MSKLTSGRRIAVAVLIVIVGVGLFYGGLVYGGNLVKNSRPGGGQFAQPAGNGVRRQFAGGAMVNGAVLSKDEQSITVKSRDGGSKIVFFSPKTKILKSVEGSVDDLTADSNVTVSGQNNPDGSVAAEMIQLRQDQAFFGSATGTPDADNQRPGDARVGQ